MKSPFRGASSAILEAKNLRSNGWKMFSVIAIALIPLIYAGLFLLAFLDPYGSLSNVPAVVVNYDKGATVNGEVRYIGQELCDSLVENNANAKEGEASGYDWKFISSEEEARQGLEDGTYYMELVIPENFSAAIASAENANPENAELQVYFNPSTNLIAQTVGSSMVTKIKAELNQKVGKTYYENIFVSISDASDTLKTAVNGSHDLADGLGDAYDGSNTITTSLGTLYDGTVTLQDGMDELSDGATTLAEGTDTLVTGLETLSDGVSQLDDGGSTLYYGLVKLRTEGTSALSSGAQQLAASTVGLPDEETVSLVKAASQQISSGFTSLQGGVSNVKTGVGSLKDALGSSYDTSSSTINGGLNQIAGGITSVDDGLADLAEGIGSSDDTSSSTVNGGLNQLAAGIGDPDDTSSSTVYGGLNQVLAGIGDSDDTSSYTVNGGLNQLAAAASSLASTAATEQQLYEAAIAYYQAGDSDTGDYYLNLAQQAAAGVEAYAEGISGGISNVQSGVAQVSGGVSQVESRGLAQISAGVSGVKSGVGAVLYGVNALRGGTGQLSAGVQGVKSGIGSSSDTEATSLYGGLNQLDAGLGTATDTTSDTLAGGINQLGAGYNQLATQISPLIEGAPALKAAIAQLSSGAETVDENMAAIVSGGYTLSYGLASLRSSVGVSTDTSTDTLYGGINSLNSGSWELADGAEEAADGVVDLVDGAKQLQEGSQTLTDGIKTAQDGAVELYDGLDDGQKEMADKAANGTERAEMMSAAVQANGDSNTGENITKVSNYGTGFAPYFIGLGMWVGCLMITFLMRTLNNRLLMSNAPSLSAVFASYLPMAAIAIVQVLILLLLIQFGLGFSVNFVPQYYLFGILVALAFMAIIQFFRATFGTAGLVVVVILLMVQLCTAAGTFPIEAELPIFNILNPILPMTYVVRGFRVAMCGLSVGYMAVPAVVLAAFTVGFLALTTLVAHHKSRASMNTLYPKIEIAS